MARKWTSAEEEKYRAELKCLYVTQNLSIGEISKKISLSQGRVYQRLVRLKIPIQRHLKKGYNNTSRKVVIPEKFTEELAEFFGIMLGDGHISNTQVIVTLGIKELQYVRHVAKCMQNIFRTRPAIFTRQASDRNSKYRNVYFGSVAVVRWLKKYGLTCNKVKDQVKVPLWIFSKREYMISFLRGFFDTDGSFYRLRFGAQISFTNYSTPILHALQEMLKKLEYKPSQVSGIRLYLTKREDIRRFFREVKPANSKHVKRYREICAGRPVEGGGRL